MLKPSPTLTTPSVKNSLQTSFKLTKTLLNQNQNPFTKILNSSSQFKNSTMAGGRFRELLKKYGKVALGVHFSVSGASIAGLYVAIKNNVDVESIFEKVGIKGVSKSEQEQENSPNLPPKNPEMIDESFGEGNLQNQVRNRTADLAASSGGALALAILCNKALFPIRVPITIALTPPISRFLARRRIIKNNV